MLKIQNLSKSYSNQISNKKSSDLDSLILSNVSWEVPEKKFVALFGKSGSGKSTFLNVASGIDQPNAGSVFFDTINLYHLSDFELSEIRLKNFGFIFQTFNLISTLTAFENIEYPLVLLKLAKKDRLHKVKELVQAVGLEGHEDKMPSQMSGGQRQRVAIARALVKDPKIIFADEPTANLDEKTADEVLQLLVRLQEKNNSAIVYVTHDPDIMRFAEKRYLLTRGQIKEYANV